MRDPSQPAGAAREPAADRIGRGRAWMLAARVPTLPAAIAPVLVGTAAAAQAGQARALPALGALVVALAIQIGTNLANDAFDFLRGADTAHRLGPVRVTQRGLLGARDVLLGAYVCFGIAGVVGAWFAVERGWPVLLAGALAIAAGLGYTGGPWPIGYHGLGEMFVFLFFGLLAVTGTAYVQSGTIEAAAVGASVPVGLLCAAILIVNNLRDIETDRAAGKRTLAVRLGPRGARVLYAACLAAAGAAPAVLRAAGLLGPGFWLPWLAAPLGAVLLRTVARANPDPASLNRALAGTARLHLLYAALLAGSLLW